ncbi:MAG: periplasmic heavy metal sensor [Desulfobacterales bacterium]
MNKKYRKLKIILIAAIAILFSGIYASADGGKGYGHHRGMHQGQGWHQRGYGGPGCAAMDNLSEDETKKLDAERTAFFESTKGLRRKIYQKRLELASELAKENPDAALAATLQKDISDFKAQMAQKHLEHILRVQKINPDLGRGFWGGGPMGPGMMHRGMMGPGGKGNRGAYNCPFGGPGGGYGMGSGMMKPGGGGSRGPGNCPYGGSGGGYGTGPGMMHRGGYGRGPDGSGRDCPRQYDKRQDSQAE